MKKLVFLLVTTVGCGVATPEGPSDGGSATAAAAGATSGKTSAGTSGSSGASGAGASVAGTSGTSSSAAAGSSAAQGSSGSARSTAAANSGSSGGGNTNGLQGCFPDGSYVGPGNASMCCTSTVTPDGFCGTGAVPSTGAVGTTGLAGSAGNTTGFAASTSTGTGSTGAAGSTGTTGAVIGSPCPNNMPNIHTGQTTKAGACGSGVDVPVCPTGFACVDGECILNGVDSPLQITLSWDDPEDLDLHVLEPDHPGAGYGPGGNDCEIFYGNPGPVPMDAGFPNIPGFDGGIFGNLFGDGGILSHLGGKPCSVGWLDRDSNAACRVDNVDIENVLYPQTPPAPSGTYIVRVDYWQQCDSHRQSAYAVQIRNHGVYTTYCGEMDASQADQGDKGSGTTITTFTVP